MLTIKTNAKQRGIVAKWLSEAARNLLKTARVNLDNMKRAGWAFANEPNSCWGAPNYRRPKNETHAQFDHLVLDGLWIY